MPVWTLEDSNNFLPDRKFKIKPENRMTENIIKTYLLFSRVIKKDEVVLNAWTNHHHHRQSATALLLHVWLVMD